LGGGGGACSAGAASGGAYHTEDSEFGESGAGYEQAETVAGAVWRSDLDAAVEHAQQVIGDEAFDLVAAYETEADPEAFLAGTTEEGFAGGFEGLVEFADEIDALDFDQGDGLALAFHGKQIGGV
jgi:hypothetical protein